METYGAVIDTEVVLARCLFKFLFYVASTCPLRMNNDATNIVYICVLTAYYIMCHHDYRVPLVDMGHCLEDMTSCGVQVVALGVQFTTVTKESSPLQSSASTADSASSYMEERLLWSNHHGRSFGNSWSDLTLTSSTPLFSRVARLARCATTARRSCYVLFSRVVSSHFVARSVSQGRCVPKQA